MPVFWMPPAMAQAGPVGAMPQMHHQAPLPAVQQSPDSIVIEAPTAKMTRLPTGERTFEYSDGVVATYFPTVIHADHMILHETAERRWGEAYGNVRLDDPEGMVTANRIVFDWTNRTGSAENVLIDAGGMRVTAEHMEIVPGRWDLTNVTATSCARERPPLYLIKTKRLTIKPGHTAVATHPRFSFFGHPIVTLPTQTLSLDQRNPGFRFPALSYKPGNGFGMSWFSGFLLDDQTSLTGNASAFPREYPSFQLQLARTFIPPEKSMSPIPPRSEMTERFSFSYLDNVSVPQTLSEANFLKSPRNAMSVSSAWNIGASARDVDSRYSKPLEVAYELGGKFGGFSAISEARLHFIRQGSGPVHLRSVVQTSVGVPSVQLARYLSTRVRFDASTFLGGTAFGWGRAQLGVQYQPKPGIGAGLALVESTSFGTPLFPIDELFSRHAVHGRIDLTNGPTTFSFLVKYDTDRKNIYDREYVIRQVVGCIEPFILYRKFPSSYQIGFRLRADDFFGAIQRRRVTRTKPTGPTVISGPSK